MGGAAGDKVRGTRIVEGAAAILVAAFAVGVVQHVFSHKHRTPAQANPPAAAPTISPTGAGSTVQGAPSNSNIGVAPSGSATIVAPPPVSSSAPVIPTVAWKPAALDVTAGGKVPFSFTIAPTSPGEEVVLQRSVGTDAVWQTAQSLQLRSGNDEISSVPAGEQNYRLAVLDASGSLLTSTPGTSIYGYQDMPLATVLSSQLQSSIVIGSRDFVYVAAPNLDSFQYTDDRTGITLWSVTSSTCRSLTLTFGTLSGDHQPIGIDAYNLPDVVKVVQESADPVSLRVTPGTVTSMTVGLTRGQSFAIALSGSYYIYFNGTASCYMAPQLVPSG